MPTNRILQQQEVVFVVDKRRDAESKALTTCYHSCYDYNGNDPAPFEQVRDKVNKYVKEYT